MSRYTPRFPSGPFQSDLRRRVDGHFLASGEARRDQPRMYVKTAVILAWAAASYALLTFAATTWWQAVPAAISLGLALAGIGFNIGHDGGHGAYSRKPLVNALAAMSFDFMGASSYVWSWKHNVFHHTYTNIHRVDDDIDMGALARVAPDQRRRWFHRFQHVYMFVMLGLLPLKWYLLDDFRSLASARVGSQPFPRARGGRLALLVSGKLVSLGWTVVIPLLFHRAWVVAVFYLLSAFVMGVTLGVVFQLAHCVGEASFPTPRPGSERMELEWAVHQVETTVDFARGSRLVSWYVGGLNFQIEHHLFPQICHVHYPALARIVEATCADHGVRYAAHPSAARALVSHFHWLRRMGRPAIPLAGAA